MTDDNRDNNGDGGGKIRLLVLGAGPGGYPAAFLAADLGMDVTLVDLEEKPGGVCLYRGCIPSKALLHVARFLNEVREAADWGIQLDRPLIDLDTMRKWKDHVVAKLTNGLGTLRRRRGVRSLQGRGRLVDAHHARVELNDGGQETVEFDYAIVATGSLASRLPSSIPQPKDSARVMTSTEALMIQEIPDRLLVVGGGYIGLELGTVYNALGSKVTVVEMTSGLLPGVDRDLVDFLHKRLAKRYEKIYLDTKVTELREHGDAIVARLSGLNVDHSEQEFDKVLVAVGRRPNSRDIGLENTRVELDDKGFIKIDHQRRTAEPSIFAIGDVAGEPMLAHKATYEARIAVEAIAGQPAAYDPQAIPAVVFTDPEVAWTGISETQAKTEGRSYKIARFPWIASGRATTLDRNDGLTKLVLDPISQRVLGVGIAGVNAGELIAEGTLAVEMNARADDVQMTIHAHPTLSETVMEAAEAFYGHSTHMAERK